MTKVLVTESHLADIANAIRYKLGGDDTYRPGDMAAAITAIPAGGGSTLVSKTITQNGGYDPEDDSADGYSDVTVNVPNSYTAEDEGKVVSSGALVAQTSRNVTTNGTYDTTENNEVVVNVSGGSAIIKTLLYQINESQGGVWINTEIDVSQIDTLMFEDIRSDAIQKYAVIDVANIAVYTGGADVYTNVYTQYRPFNIRIYNNYLYVSYNGGGPSTNVTKVYSYTSINDVGGLA